MPEFQQCCRIRYLFIDEVDSKKTSHGIAVIDGFFYSFIRKIEPVLHEVHAEHDFNIFWPASTLVAVIVGSDELDPLIPWNDFIHGIRNSSRFVFRRRLEYSMSQNDCCFMQHTILVFDTSIIQDMVSYLKQKS